ncbi:hypothetical protein MRX96_009955 [Rhipicephalus microplus]
MQEVAILAAAGCDHRAPIQRLSRFTGASEAPPESSAHCRSAPHKRTDDRKGRTSWTPASTTLVLPSAPGTWCKGRNIITSLGQGGWTPTRPENLTASPREEVASLNRTDARKAGAQLSCGVSNNTAGSSLHISQLVVDSPSTTAIQERANSITATLSSGEWSPAKNEPGTSHPASSHASGTSSHDTGEQYSLPENPPRISAALSANVSTTTSSLRTHSVAASEVTQCAEDVTVQSVSPSMTLSRSSEVLNYTNTTSTKFPNVPMAGHEASLENSSTSLMSNEFGTSKTDSLTSNVLASTKDAATSTSADAPRTRTNKGAIFATVIGATVLLMGIIVMGLWFYNVRWKLNRDRPVLRQAAAPDTTPIPFSIVYYQNDGVQIAGLRRN